MHVSEGAARQRVAHVGRLLLVRQRILPHLQDGSALQPRKHCTSVCNSVRPYGGHPSTEFHQRRLFALLYFRWDGPDQHADLGRMHPVSRKRC